MKRILLFALIACTAVFGFQHVIVANARAADGSAPMRFAVIGDRTGGHQPGIHARIIQEIEHLKPDFVIGVGDMIEGYSSDTVAVKQEWAEYRELLEPLSMPVYLIPGNHDIWDDASEALYRRYVGEPYYSFDVGSAHFLVLDTSRWDSASVIPSEQLEWARTDLIDHRAADHIFAVFHKPYWIETIAAGRRNPIHSLLVEYGVDAVFTGHYHVYFSGEFDGVKYTGVGSSGGYCEPGLTGLEYHFVWVTVDDGGISISPIQMGSVLPWDEVTAGFFRFAREVEDEAVSIDRLKVGEATVAPEADVGVTIANLDSSASLIGSLEWEVPAGWSVSPKAMPVQIAPSQSHKAVFSVRGLGSIYPTPVLSVEYPYAESKHFTVTKSLSVIRSVRASRAARPPTIDGMVREQLWLESVSQYYAPDGTPVTAEPVDVYFAWDDSSLYIAAECSESDMASAVATVGERDGAVYGEDCVGFFLQPQVADGPVYQVYFNMLGTIFDQEIEVADGRAVDADPGWNGDYEVKTFKGGDFWSIEIRIPLEQLGTVGAYEQTWALNFRRKQRRLNSSADWQVPIGYDPQDYGILVMR
jgi:hypothetical protein